MRNYRLSTATESRVNYGVELSAGLRGFPETAPLADPFEGLTDQLDDTHAARRTARKPMAKARAKRRIAGYALRQCIRSFSRAAEIADGGRRGAIYFAAFPNGTADQVKALGPALVTATTALLDRLAKSKVAGLDSLRAEWSPKITAAFTGLTDATSVFEVARTAYQDLFSTEVALRDQHRVEVERIMGRVRAAFPGDADKQDLVFPEPDDEAPAEGKTEKAPAEGEAKTGKAPAAPKTSKAPATPGAPAPAAPAAPKDGTW